ncbi:hypothetical protein ACFL7D_04365 [candidate division KSB1 bacterium]
MEHSVPAEGVEPDTEMSVLFVLNPENETRREFGSRYGEFSVENRNKLLVNRVHFDVNQNNEVFISYCFRNRIEKYDRDGSLLTSFNRMKNIDSETVPEYIWDTYMMPSGAASDKKGRLWVSTLVNQPEEGNNQDFRFEIFTEEGILLGSVPQTRQGKLRIFENILFIIDSKENMCVYQYEIIEK